MRIAKIYQIARADILNRGRNFSFLVVCFSAIFLAFFSVPDVDAPLVSIAMEPAVFAQGTNPSWIPVAIALCGGLLFPIIGFSYVQDSICTDRRSGFLYHMEAMNLKKSSYVAGKFLSNLVLLTVMWGLTIIGSILIMLFRFPGVSIPVYDFISPFLCLYPGILFASACSVIIESLPVYSYKNANAAGIVLLFGLFLTAYQNSGSDSLIYRIMDFGSYRWVMDSINAAVIPAAGHAVQESGILVPGGMFAGSGGLKELVFHGLVLNGQFIIDKLLLLLLSICLVIVAILSLETTERTPKALRRRGHASDGARIRRRHCGGYLLQEAALLLRGAPAGWRVFMSALWVTSILIPLAYVQDYIWVIMLILSVLLFSQIGAREHEYGTYEYLSTIKYALRRQLVCHYLYGSAFLFVLSLPLMLRTIMSGNNRAALSYLLFTLFIPALACFLGEFFRTRRAFEALYLLLCFLLLNMPGFLFLPAVNVFMAACAVIMPCAAVIKRG